MPDSRDETLVSKLREGDLDALKQLHEVYGNSVFETALNLLSGNKLIAYDISANAFISLWSDRERLKNIENVRAYLYVYVRSACTKYLNEK